MPQHCTDMPRETRPIKRPLLRKRQKADILGFGVQIIDCCAEWVLTRTGPYGSRNTSRHAAIYVFPLILPQSLKICKYYCGLFFSGLSGLHCPRERMVNPVR